MVEGAYACGQCWHGSEAACGEETTSECDQNEGLHAFFVSVAVLGFVLVSGSKLADWIWHVLDLSCIVFGGFWGVVCVCAGWVGWVGCFGDTKGVFMMGYACQTS